MVFEVYILKGYLIVITLTFEIVISLSIYPRKGLDTKKRIKKKIKSEWERKKKGLQLRLWNDFDKFLHSILCHWKILLNLILLRSGNSLAPASQTSGYGIDSCSFLYRLIQPIIELWQIRKYPLWLWAYKEETFSNSGRGENRNEGSTFSLPSVRIPVTAGLRTTARLQEESHYLRNTDSVRGILLMPYFPFN